MKPMHEHPSRNHPNRESIEELCCLFVLGDLSREDRSFLEGHLKECEECRDLVEGFERIALFDLPAVASLRTENFVPESLEFANEIQIRTRVLERAKAGLERNEIQNRLAQDIVRRYHISWLRQAKRGARFAVPAAGWAIAAILLLGVFWKSSPQPQGITHVAIPVVAPVENSGNLNELKNRSLAAEKQRDEALGKLSDAEALNRSSSLSLSQMKVQYDSLNASYSALKGETTLQDDELKQRAAELDLTRKELKEQLSAKESLQGQLAEVYERLDHNSAEVARLEKVASTTPARLPVSAKEIDGNEAKEILGARELHLVDVFDVDNAGKSSRAYGRVYYVNRDLLVFYAFDLSKLERNHKAVAFQAWGFRQPQSTNAESLGLFYMDNATLNRWTLRVSDPQVLSRIDTMFVTVEPPGGSRFPKGRRLLMASLAGPANHP
jgi:anti-sigma-K factor RskA